MTGARRNKLVGKLLVMPKTPLALLPTPMHRLPNFARHFGDIELWIKRDDLTGLEGGGNKTRKLEYLVGDATASGADMLVTTGAIQSNHTRQTAAAAAKSGLKCALLHVAWARDAGPMYRRTGNILLSSLMGAELYFDETSRPIEDQSPLLEFCSHLQAQGHRTYLIPGGASEHRLGSFGYMGCAAEISQQGDENNTSFNYVVHCSGSGSTQSGLLAGFKFMGESTRVIGVADDFETDIKRRRVLELSNAALEAIDSPLRLTAADVEIIAADASNYGEAEPGTYDIIRKLAASEGLVADPVYEGKALRGLQKLAGEGRFETGSKVLLMHLGGTPAVHAYGNQFGNPRLMPYSQE